MRSFQAVILFLFALCAMVYAESSSDSTSYDSTVYVTSTIYRVNTISATGTAPSGVPVNSTSTIAPTYASATAASYSGNGTTIKPTGSMSSPTTTPFVGAASGLSVNGAFAVVLAAGLGLLAL